MTRLTILFAAALQAAPATGSLAGCITDPARHGIPGVTVTMTTADARQLCVETDKAGCYEVNDLIPGSHRVTGRLLGFDRVTKRDVNVASRTAARLGFDDEHQSHLRVYSGRTSDAGEHLEGSRRSPAYPDLGVRA